MSKVLNISIAVLLLTTPAWADWTQANSHGSTELWGSNDDVSLDLASVITPEPVTLLVLGLGLIPALLRRRKRTSSSYVSARAHSKPSPNSNL